jgi:hypothetical protein
MPGTARMLYSYEGRRKPGQTEKAKEERYHAGLLQKKVGGRDASLVEFNIENDDYNAHRVRASNDVICLI